MKVLYTFIILACVSLSCEASRFKESVSFDLENANTNSKILPFTAHVPNDFRGSFIRFINPKNGKSVVAKIVKRSGKAYHTNIEIKKMIDINSTIAIVFIEAVY